MNTKGSLFFLLFGGSVAEEAGGHFVFWQKWLILQSLQPYISLDAPTSVFLWLYHSSLFTSDERGGGGNEKWQKQKKKRRT